MTRRVHYSLISRQFRPPTYIYSLLPTDYRRGDIDPTDTRNGPNSITDEGRTTRRDVIEADGVAIVHCSWILRVNAVWPCNIGRICSAQVWNAGSTAAEACYVGDIDVGLKCRARALTSQGAVARRRQQTAAIHRAASQTHSSCCLGPHASH